MGWSLKNDHLENCDSDILPHIIADRNKITTFEDYSNLLSKYNIYGGNVNPNVNRFYYDMKPNDLVWIRSAGIYYLGRITENSHWKYDNSQTALDLDASNQITDVKWYKIGDESDVPGAITTSLIRGQTLQKIWKTGVWEYSQLIYNEKAGSNFYTGFELKDSMDTFYSLLSPDDCEDLLCLWLYSKYGYITIPSTNKKSTECYECVLKDPKTGKNIYPQVKAGEVTLYEKDYFHLDGEVWLFTTKGCVEKDNCNNHKNIHVADPNEIFAFAGTDIAANILPKSIITWKNRLSKI